LQVWLPEDLGSLANSSGTWALVAFALALLAVVARAAAFFGCVALPALLGGYVLGADVRGYASGTALVVFWGASALVVGPALGVGARWVSIGRRTAAAVGIGAMSGVLIGEGVKNAVPLSDWRPSAGQVWRCRPDPVHGGALGVGPSAVLAGGRPCGCRGSGRPTAYPWA
jgi:hypothetical protein